MRALTSLVAAIALAACPLPTSRTTPLGGRAGGDPAATTVDRDATATVPDLSGKTKEDAIAAVRAAGFTYPAQEYPLACDGAPPAVGRVACQDPDPGARVQRYTLVRLGVTHEDRLRDVFLRKDFDALRGLTVERARARAQQAGHTGSIKVAPTDRYVEGCNQGTVCTATDQLGGQSGMSKRDTLVLRINEALSIAPPPE
jgi:hypothetical protein